MSRIYFLEQKAGGLQLILCWYGLTIAILTCSLIFLVRSTSPYNATNLTPISYQLYRALPENTPKSQVTQEVAIEPNISVVTIPKKYHKEAKKSPVKLFH